MPQQEKKSLAKELIELGKQKGQLTNQDILDALGEQDLDPLGVARTDIGFRECVPVTLKQHSAVLGADVLNAQKFQLVGTDALQAEDAGGCKGHVHRILSCSKKQGG